MILLGSWQDCQPGNSHVNNIVAKSSKRIYLLVQLKREKVAIQDILQFYTVCIRPILEYASTFFHYSLPKYLSDEIDEYKNGFFELYIRTYITKMHWWKLWWSHCTLEGKLPATNFLIKF
jgi:hypothetical protein